MKLFLMDLSWAPPQSFLTTQSSWALRTYLGVLQHRSVRLWRKEANSGTSSAAPLSTVPTPGLWVQHTLPHRACLAAATRRATHCTPRCATRRATHCGTPLRIERNSRKPCGLLLLGGGSHLRPAFPHSPVPACRGRPNPRLSRRRNTASGGGCRPACRAPARSANARGHGAGGMCPTPSGSVPPS